MAEIRTSPVNATHIPDKDQFKEDCVPGAFRVSEPDADGESFFWYRCPCGCETIGVFAVGQNFKPADSPSWNWNGSTDKPSLSPSVHHVGHWHGWLTDGVWRSC